MEVLYAGFYALIGSVLFSLGLQIRTIFISRGAESKRKSDQAIFDSNQRNRELEQELVMRNALAKATDEMTEQSKGQRDLIDAANSKVASTETAIGILQTADIENRRLSADQDRLLGEQKAELSALKADKATFAAAIAALNTRLETMTTLNTAKEAEIISLKEIIQKGVDASAEVQRAWAEERKAMQARLDSQQQTIEALKAEVAELRKLIAPSIVLPEGVAAK